MTSSLDIALSVAVDLGLSVFPCKETLKEKGKVSKRPYTENGFKDASREEVQIRKWWGNHPNALVGVPTGPKTGILVVDIDQSSEKSGEASFNKLQIEDPETTQTRTVSGGRHLIFAYPEPYDIRNNASTKLGKDIDVRGDGGYIIWAGSKTVLGDYAYREGYSPGEKGFQPLPERLQDILTGKIKINSDSETSGHIIPNGQRNDTLFKEAVRLAGKGVDKGVVAQHVFSRMQDCQGGFPSTEALTVINSATKIGHANAPPFTDLGNAERFARDHSSHVIYCMDQRRWYCWDGNRWKPDPAKVQQCAKETTRNMLAEPSYSEQHRSALTQWQRQSESNGKQKAMIELAASEHKLVKQSTDLDRHLHLFNAADGTIDLHTGEVKVPDRSDLLTCISDAHAKADNACPKWTQFISEIMLDDKKQIDYLQRLCGYMMSGNRSEQIIIYLQGDGANGKSVFIDVLSHVFGDYAGSISARALIDRANGAIPSDIAAIAGKRLVTMSEFPERTYINTTTVKAITGGDKVTARHLYKDWFEFKPQFQLLCAMNELPKVFENDEAYLRRVRIIPFRRVFNGTAIDRNLSCKLKAEADGILQWCLEGARLYKKQGLEPTPLMLEVLEEYRRKSDPVAEFVRVCIVRKGGQSFHSLDDLVREVRQYLAQEDLPTPDESTIKKSLRRWLGDIKQHRTSNGRVRGYFGLAVEVPMDADVPF